VAVVTVYDTDKVDELIVGTVVGAAITGGHLILTLHDGTTVDVGAVVSAIADASTSAKGLVELATDTETVTGTDTVRAVTPFGLAAVVASATAKGLVELATTTEATTGTDTVRAVTPAGLKAMTDTKQPLDADLTAVAALVPTNGDFLEYTSGAWANRTPTQAGSVLSTSGSLPIVWYTSGSTYASIAGPAIYVGPVDPGTPPNGSIWFDTTGA
jgi:hypothetical protein